PLKNAPGCPPNVSTTVRSVAGSPRHHAMRSAGGGVGPTTRNTHNCSLARPVASPAETVKPKTPSAAATPLTTPFVATLMPGGALPRTTVYTIGDTPSTVVNATVSRALSVTSGNCALDTKYGRERSLPVKSEL